MHEFTATNGTKSTSSVRWKWEPFEGEPKVALYDFTPRFPRSQSGGVVLLGVEKAWGRIRLYRSYDLDQYYAKEWSRLAADARYWETTKIAPKRLGWEMFLPFLRDSVISYAYPGLTPWA